MKYTREPLAGAFRGRCRAIILENLSHLMIQPEEMNTF